MEGLQLDPEEVATLRAALTAADACPAAAEAKVSDHGALIAHLRLEIRGQLSAKINAGGPRGYVALR